MRVSQGLSQRISLSGSFISRCSGTTGGGVACAWMKASGPLVGQTHSRPISSCAAQPGLAAAWAGKGSCCPAAGSPAEVACPQHTADRKNDASAARPGACMRLVQGTGRREAARQALRASSAHKPPACYRVQGRTFTGYVSRQARELAVARCSAALSVIWGMWTHLPSPEKRQPAQATLWHPRPGVARRARWGQGPHRGRRSSGCRRLLVGPPTGALACRRAGA